MNPELALVLLMLAVSMGLFIWGRPRMDVVALLVIIGLPLAGILSLEQSVAGFSNPAVLLIASLFVIGHGLVRTGIAYQLGDLIVKHAATSEVRLLVFLMVSVALLSSIMSSTGVVAIFIPIVLTIAKRLKISPATLLMPLSFAALIGGTLTLVATPPNLVVSAELVRNGLQGFGFFSFTPIGLLLLALGIIYMLLVRRWLGGNKQANQDTTRNSLSELADAYGLTDRERRLLVLPHSPIANRPLDELALRQQYGINVIAIERPRKFRRVLELATRHSQIRAGDTLLVDLASPAIALAGAYQELGLEQRPLPISYYRIHAPQMGLAEVALPPESTLPGKTIQELGFRSRYRLNVVGLRRQGKALPGLLVDEPLKAADTLLVAGSWENINKLYGQSRDFMLFNLPAEIDEVAPARDRAPFALLSLGVMVALMVSGLVPNLMAVLIGCLLMGLFGCISMDSAYKAIHWPSLLLIIGMLPFALALEETGGIDLAVGLLLDSFGETGPRALLAALFIATALIGLFISNTATAVLMAPVAVATAQAVGASPYPFAMVVALAASAAFMTPVSSPVNTLVLDPGGYRFTDFLRIGVPFTLLILLVSIVLVPLLFPL